MQPHVNGLMGDLPVATMTTCVRCSVESPCWLATGFRCVSPCAGYWELYGRPAIDCACFHSTPALPHTWARSVSCSPFSPAASTQECGLTARPQRAWQRAWHPCLWLGLTRTTCPSARLPLCAATCCAMPRYGRCCPCELWHSSNKDVALGSRLLRS